MVPLQLLIAMFSDGVNSLKELANQRKARSSDISGNSGARRVRGIKCLQTKKKEREKTQMDFIKNMSSQTLGTKI